MTSSQDEHHNCNRTWANYKKVIGNEEIMDLHYHFIILAVLLPWTCPQKCNSWQFFSKKDEDTHYFLSLWCPLSTSEICHIWCILTDYMDQKVLRISGSLSHLAKDKFHLSHPPLAMFFFDPPNTMITSPSSQFSFSCIFLKTQYHMRGFRKKWIIPH